MMARQKFPSDDLAQFMVRMPPDLRDRIKTYAERHGRSMNTEIVRVLEVHFPPPYSLAERIEELIHLSQALKEMPSTSVVESLIDKLYDAVKGIAQGKAEGIDEETREKVAEILDRWSHERHEEFSERIYANMDEDEILAIQEGKGPF
jgi:predicted DNA-binding protein